MGFEQYQGSKPRNERSFLQHPTSINKYAANSVKQTG